VKHLITFFTQKYWKLNVFVDISAALIKPQMGEHIYILKADESLGNSFYEDLSLATDQILKNFYTDPSIIHIREFRDYISMNNIEKPRTIEMYFIEYVMIGLFWKNYSGYASGLSKTSKTIADVLYSAGRTYEPLKPTVDKLRGRLATQKLLKLDKSIELLPLIENLQRLVNWLDATKDFIEECKRLQIWLDFLKSKSPIYFANFLNSTREISARFVRISHKNLSAYTRGVNPFLAKAKRQYKFRDDIIFCTRPEIDYLFNMVATEIFNRAQKPAFTTASRKIVLLPACLSSPESGICEAKMRAAGDKKCARCTKGCRVNEISRTLEEQGMEVMLLPVSADYSAYLKNWEHNPDTGLVDVACVLKIMQNGYKMAALNIPSQLIFLDYAGCQLHWPGVNKPTGLNTKKLYGTLEIHRNSISNFNLVLN
jgi:uncharacterized protein